MVGGIDILIITLLEKASIWRAGNIERHLCWSSHRNVRMPINLEEALSVVGV